jgi:hypothetical protein
MYYPTYGLLKPLLLGASELLELIARTGLSRGAFVALRRAQSPDRSENWCINLE